MNEGLSANQVGKPEGRRYWALGEMILARVREFLREPEAVFWVYGFPILLTIALGLAFRNKPVERYKVDVAQQSGSDKVLETLRQADRFDVEVHDLESARRRLKTGKSDLVVIPTGSSGSACEFLLMPGKPESTVARDDVASVLEDPGRLARIEGQSKELEEEGGRYIDFLVPGLLGMGLMGGGLWGVGFVTVDMRIRKLLKRFLATPMSRGDFLAALMISRLLFMVPEVLILLLFAWIAFGVGIAGSIGAVVVLILVGAFSFAGIGLLVASRARTLETVSGLMNLVMLPMWVFSGVFFNPDRFPDPLQPFIQALPLTALLNALRAVMLEGATLLSQWVELTILLAWGVVTFVLALRWFRWS
jgi:ABC-type multidrug transport system permease subunit